MQVSRKINDMQKQAGSAHNDARQLGFDLLDRKEDGEHNCVGSVDISGIIATLDDFFLESILLDRA